MSSDDEQQTAMAYKTSTENKVDIIEESSDDEEDDDRHPNPLVADSHDLDSAGEETPADIQPTTTTPLEVKTEKPTAMATSTQEDNQQETVDKRPSIETTSDLNDESSADENETDSKYEVVADFDLDEPELDNWLGGSDDVEASQNKKKPSKEVRHPTLSVRKCEEKCFKIAILREAGTRKCLTLGAMVYIYIYI